MFREEGKLPCKFSGTRDLDLRGAEQVMLCVTLQCPPNTWVAGKFASEYLPAKIVSTQWEFTTLLVSATCLALHVLWGEFFLYSVSCSRNVHNGTFLGFPVISFLTGGPVTHTLKVVVCCQNCWKIIRNCCRQDLQYNSQFLCIDV